MWLCAPPSADSEKHEGTTWAVIDVAGLSEAHGTAALPFGRRGPASTAGHTTPLACASPRGVRAARVSPAMPPYSVQHNSEVASTAAPGALEPRGRGADPSVCQTQEVQPKGQASGRPVQSVHGPAVQTALPNIAPGGALIRYSDREFGMALRPGRACAPRRGPARGTQGKGREG